jgi:hypothetical protein
MDDDDDLEPVGSRLLLAHTAAPNERERVGMVAAHRCKKSTPVF